MKSKKRIVSKISQTHHDRTKPAHMGTMLIQGLPVSTKTQFKVACAKNEITMRDALITFMREYAKEAGLR